MDLKDIPESAVVQQVKQLIKVTGLKLQRINTGCFRLARGETAATSRRRTRELAILRGTTTRGGFALSSVSDRLAAD